MQMLVRLVRNEIANDSQYLHCQSELRHLGAGLQIDRTRPEARTPRRIRSVREKEAILAAAQELFLTERYELISSTEIARRAGVDDALPARYFGGKRALLIRICEDLAGQILAEFDRPPARSASLERMLRGSAVHVFSALAGQASQRLHHLFSAHVRELRLQKERWRQRLVSAVASRLREGFAQLDIHPRPPADEAAGLLYDLSVTYLAASRGVPSPSAGEIGHWGEAAGAMLLRRSTAPAGDEDQPRALRMQG